MRTGLALLLCLLFGARASGQKDYDYSTVPRLPPSRVVRMSLEQWDDYSAKKGAGRKAALDYYRHCQQHVNQRRIRRFPRATQRQWRSTEYELRRWFDAYFDYYVTAVHPGTISFPIYIKDRVYLEKCLWRIMEGYGKPQTSRKRTRAQFERVWETMASGFPISPDEDTAVKEEIRTAQAAWKKANRRMRRFLLQRSPNTLRAISDCIRKMMDEEAS